MSNFTASALTEQLKQFIPEYAQGYRRVLDAQFRNLAMMFPGAIPGTLGTDSVGSKGISVYNSRYYAVFKYTVRPVCIDRTVPANGCTSGNFVHSYEISEEKAGKAAQEYAEAVVGSFVQKLSEKLGDLEEVKVVYHSGCNISITGLRGTEEVSISQKMILNCSAKGTLFNQFPAIIRVNGKTISEKKYKGE